MNTRRYRYSGSRSCVWLIAESDTGNRNPILLYRLSAEESSKCRRRCAHVRRLLMACQRPVHCLSRSDQLFAEQSAKHGMICTAYSQPEFWAQAVAELNPSGFVEQSVWKSAARKRRRRPSTGPCGNSLHGESRNGCLSCSASSTGTTNTTTDRNGFAGEVVRGYQRVVGAIDALLAQLCIRHDLVMLSTDRDFSRIADWTPLQPWRASGPSTPPKSTSPDKRLFGGSCDRTQLNTHNSTPNSPGCL